MISIPQAIHHIMWFLVFGSLFIGLLRIVMRRE